MILTQDVWDIVHDIPEKFQFLGMNLREVNYYDDSFPFCNRMKNCDEWRTTRVSSPTSNLDAYDFNLRTDGYPTELPQSDGEGIDDYCVATYIIWSTEYPTGDWVLRFKGTGSITLQENASGTYTTPDVEHAIAVTEGQGVRLVVTSSDISDPIRDIEFIFPECSEIYKTQTFHPEFLRRLEGYSHIRFMWWGDIWSGDYNTDWSLRRTPDYYTQGGERGVSLEYMVELCNTLQCDAWICVPHTCTDDYMLNTAQFIHTNLDSNLKWYFEYSNETWNGGDYRVPSKYVQDQGIALGLDAIYGEFGGGQVYTALRSAQLFQIINTVYGASSERVVRVLSGQTVAFNVNLMLEYLQTEQPTLPFPDMFATAPYFGGSVGQDIVSEGIVDTITTDEIIDRMVANMVDTQFPFMEACQSIVDTYGIPHIMYEGGHHLVPGSANQENEALVAKLIEATSDARMYQVTLDYFNGWVARGGKELCYFSFCIKDSKYGSFGILTHQTALASESPRYRACRYTLGLDPNT